MELSTVLLAKINDSLLEEFNQVAFGEELAGSNQFFCIKPSFAFAVSGEPYPVYGIYNRTTNIREGECTQYAAAKDWVKALTRVALGEDVPGLGTGKPGATAAGGMPTLN